MVRRTGKCLILLENTILRHIKRLKFPIFFDKTNSHNLSSCSNFLIVMKVEFSLSFNAKFNCVKIFGVLSNQCKKRSLVRQATRLSTVHMLCTRPTDEQNLHISAYAANENIRQFAIFFKFSCWRSIWALRNFQK